MEEVYKHISTGPASTDEISIQLYSMYRMTQDVRAQLAHNFASKLPKLEGNRLLIIGAKVGVMGRLLESYCSHIDMVAEQQYIPVLDATFIKNQPVEYNFKTQGDLGQKHILPKYKSQKCTFGIIQISKFKDSIKRTDFYDIILLQNVIVHPKINILKQLMRIQHKTLVTMIVPGKLAHPNLFQLLSGIQQNILQVFYTQATHERVQYTKYITGRRQEINFWEIFVWIKKHAPDSEIEIAKVEKLLIEEVKKNTIVADAEKGPKGMAVYETTSSINQYLDFHYSQTEYFGVKNFPVQCALKVIDAAKGENIKGRALDLGCAVGRTSIDIAQHFDEVIGIDYSHAFVDACKKVLHEKYPHLEGKIKFEQGDACNLNKQLGQFDVIFGGNLIDRLYDPEAFLNHSTKFLKPHSILILTSPYTWLQEYTKSQKWIGGREIDGKRVTTYQKLRQILTGLGLKELRDPQDLRFVICDNPWVYQSTRANITFWVRRP